MYKDIFSSQVFSFLRLVIVGVGITLLSFSTSYAARDDGKYASLVIDADTGTILHKENAGKYRYPASLTKMMTLYVTFQAIERRKLRLDQPLRVSARAASQPPSNIGLRKGQSITVKEAVMALVVKSANDAAVVLAEAVAGNEKDFALAMNKMAVRLGMGHSYFCNASGLHHPRQRTTAYDLARLSIALRRDYPQYYPYFKAKSFRYKGRAYNSHNRVTMNYRGAEGLKTGFVQASGFNLATSANRDGKHLVGIVLGGKSSRSRDKHMVNLLDRAFFTLARNTRGTEKVLASSVPTPVLRPDNLVRYAAATVAVADKAVPVPSLRHKEVKQKVTASAKKQAKKQVVAKANAPQQIAVVEKMANNITEAPAEVEETGEGDRAEADPVLEEDYILQYKEGLKK